MGVIGLLILLGLFTTVGLSLVASSSGSYANLVQGAQAFAISRAGAEWYIEQLNLDTDWSDQSSQTRLFAQGSFTIDSFAYDPASDRLTFTSTGTITSNMAGVTIKRWQKWTVGKTYAPPFNFALFEGMNTGNPLVFTDREISGTAVTVNGDLWTPGNVQISPLGDINYYIQRAVIPEGASVTGIGTYTVMNIPPPHPVMPVLNLTIYWNQMIDFDNILDTTPPTINKIVQDEIFDLSAPADPNCVAGICRFTNLTTRGNVTIKGTGTVSTNQTIRLHGEDGLVGGILTITPIGGPINFIANESIVIGSNNGAPIINSDPDVRFYSRALAGLDQLVHIRGDNTTLGIDPGPGVKIFARRRILVETGAVVTGNSELFVDQAGDPTNNLIDIVGWAAKSTSVSGGSMVVSMSLNNPAIRLRYLGTDPTRTEVMGIIYANGSPTTGYCQINDARVYGSVVCNRFNGDQIANAHFIYSDTLYKPNPPQPAFRTHVAKVSNGWDGT